MSIDQIRTLFRGFSDPEHADAFSRGEIRISTFQICRQTEDAIRRDPEEGHVTFDIDVVEFGSGMMTQEEEQLAMERMGMNFPQGGYIQGIKFRRTLQDAYILSLSEDEETAATKFGPAVVQIGHPERFMRRLSLAINEQIRRCRTYMDRVVYSKREHHILAPLPSLPPFIKPVAFEDEKEVRIVWFPLDPHGALAYAHVRAEWAGRLCQRLR